MKEKSKSEVSIIGGADGPTSIFIAGRTRKKPLKVRIRNITILRGCFFPVIRGKRCLLLCILSVGLLARLCAIL